MTDDEYELLEQRVESLRKLWRVTRKQEESASAELGAAEQAVYVEQKRREIEAKAEEMMAEWLNGKATVTN